MKNIWPLRVTYIPASPHRNAWRQQEYKIVLKLSSARIDVFFEAKEFDFMFVLYDGFPHDFF